MARIAYFQPFSGISGDMTLGALVDAGLDFRELESTLRASALPGIGDDEYELACERVFRGTLDACRFRVRVPALENDPSDEHEHSHSHGHDHSHAHDHGHHHERGQAHGHSHDHPHGADAPSDRSLSRILDMIARSRLPDAVKDSSSRVFQRLGAAEARVHGVDVESVHFHEVGAVDSIVDIIGSCLALDLLGVDEVHSAPIHVGTGWVTGSHGRLPLPAPATIELLEGFPVRQIDSGAELTTPTGAALLTALARSFGTLPESTVRSVGYGAGDDRPGPIPNCLRVILADTTSSNISDRVVLLETNIDDMPAEWLGHLMDRLFDAGALDVYMTPILMKKSRAAQQLSVLAPLPDEHEIVGVLFGESTTFGVRRREVDRFVLERRVETLVTPWGSVRMKIGKWSDRDVSTSPEFEDLRAAARKAGLPLKEMHQRVIELYRSGSKG